jgi:TetR/AcrR family transcriptional regulator, mexJK operon transcriptional repressor
MLDSQLTQDPPKRGRPRRGTDLARMTSLMDAATRVFLREGYGLASIDKVAAEAGVSTRTIYERFKNKADLLGAVISRLVERMSTVLATVDLTRLEPRSALLALARTMIQRVGDPDAVAMYRILVAEAHRFPELAAKMRETDKRCIDRTVADYFRDQVRRGALALADPDRAATLFLQMVCCELHQSLVFCDDAAQAELGGDPHLKQVIDIFLLGAAPRGA